jgi:hypothetical protein
MQSTAPKIPLIGGGTLEVGGGMLADATPGKLIQLACEKKFQITKRVQVRPSDMDSQLFANSPGTIRKSTLDRVAHRQDLYVKISLHALC